MTRREWKETRGHQINRVRSTCEHCRMIRERFDVCRNGRGYVVLCRSCRVAFQSPSIQAKAAATRHRKKLQLRFDFARAS